MSLEGPAQPAFETACELVERILTAADGLSAAQLDAVPWPESSSMFVIATHAISATEWNFVEVLAGRQVDRSREVEFDAKAALVSDPQALLRERWSEARAAMESALAGLSADAWQGEHYHKFMEKNLSGHELAMKALAHTAEHAAHAEMTRQWLEVQS